MKTSNRILSFAIASVLLSPSIANAFQVNKIEVEGANRVGFETINSYLTVEKGKQLDRKALRDSIQRLYKTGFFTDVEFYKRDDGTLVIKVVERPSISSIKIEGNSLFETDVLNTALDGLGIKTGRIYNLSQMDQVVLDLKRRYQNQGYYAATIDIETNQLERQRVDLLIKINEGTPATIGRVNLVGNTIFSDKRLKSQMATFEDNSYQGGDQYSKPKIQGDIEKIKSYYLDRGYAEFKIRSSQVSVSADKTKVFATINMDEGARYNIGKVDFIGELIVDKQEIQQLSTVKEGDVFSRSGIVKTVNAIRELLSEEGYAFADVEPETLIDRENLTMDINFKLTPKNRVYIRRIEVEGNTRTRDHVVRRELRQYESAPYSLKMVRQSKERLQRLGFFVNTNIETRKVSADKVDLIVKVEEQSTGSISAGVGFSQVDGASFNLGVSERNFIGSGNKLNLNLATSKSRKTVDVGVTNPYFTEDGISLGAGIYLSEIDAEELDVADYTTNNLGVRANIGYPLSEDAKVSFGVKVDSQELICSGDFNDKFCADFIDEFGKTNNSVVLSAGWVYNTSNAFYFPSDGQKTSVSTELVMPGTTDLTYYKVSLNEDWYQPLNKYFNLHLKAGLSFGDGYGKNDTLPFYENYYAGGIGTVRGYEPNSLGPYYNKATDGTDRPKGGSVKLTGGAALVFPVPLIEDSSNARMSLFFDTGNVYDGFENVETGELRSSVGFGVSWITPIGPLTFSLAKPVTQFDEDDHQVFQFTLGTGF